MKWIEYAANQVLNYVCKYVSNENFVAIRNSELILGR